MKVQVIEDYTRCNHPTVYTTFVVEGKVVSFRVNPPKERIDPCTSNRWMAGVEDDYRNRLVPGFVFVSDTKAGLYSILVKWIVENVLTYKRPALRTVSGYYDGEGEDFICLEQFVPKVDTDKLVKELEEAFVEVDGSLYDSNNPEDVIFKNLFIDYMRYRFIYEHELKEEVYFYVQNFLVNASRVTEKNYKEYLDDGEELVDFMNECRLDGAVVYVDDSLTRLFIIRNLERAFGLKYTTILRS